MTLFEGSLYLDWQICCCVFFAMSSRIRQYFVLNAFHNAKRNGIGIVHGIILLKTAQNSGQLAGTAI
jgi:hypothetical protein